MLKKETIERYVHIMPHMQEVEDEQNELINECLDDGETGYIFPVSLHDEEPLAMKCENGKFVLRVLHGIPEWIASDLIRENWDKAKYPRVLLDIICEGAEITSCDCRVRREVEVTKKRTEWHWEQMPFEDFDLVLSEINDEILCENGELGYLFIQPHNRGEEHLELYVKFKTYRYKFYGEISEDVYDEIRLWKGDVPHPLCVIDFDEYK